VTSPCDVITIFLNLLLYFTTDEGMGEVEDAKKTSKGEVSS
jgi:hypothetical protein